MKKIQIYYIQDTRQYLGNAVLWWGIDGIGYTVDLKSAGKYTKEEAKKICTRPTDRAWPCEYIDNIEQAKKLIIDMQYLSIGEAAKWKDVDEKELNPFGFIDNNCT